MITVNNLTKKFGGFTAVNNASLTIEEGSITGLVGPNGAGKTTTFYLIAGLIKLDSGEIFFNGNDISNLPMHKRSNMGIKYLPQEPSIFQDLTVYENLYGLAEISLKEKNKISQFMTQSIEEFSLEQILDLKGRQLSGGQRRKVEIARTLAASPKIILLDEPFAGIDPIAIDEIKNVLRTLKDKGIAILITDHNVREALDICDNAIVVNRGRVIAKGVKADLINNDLVKKVYLGNMYS